MQRQYTNIAFSILILCLPVALLFVQGFGVVVVAVVVVPVVTVVVVAVVTVVVVDVVVETVVVPNQ